MALLTVPSFGPRTAITYVTIGLLMDVWTGVWYFAFGRPAGESLSNTTCFWLAGFFLTGLSLIGIGIFLGPLGRAARRAELPPGSALGAEADIQRTAAATPQPVVTAPAVNQAVPVRVAELNSSLMASPPQKAIVLGS
jgi:hypothetical protein